MRAVLCFCIFKFKLIRDYRRVDLEGYELKQKTLFRQAPDTVKKSLQHALKCALETRVLNTMMSEFRPTLGSKLNRHKIIMRKCNIVAWLIEVYALKGKHEVDGEPDSERLRGKHIPTKLDNRSCAIMSLQ